MNNYVVIAPYSEDRGRCWDNAKWKQVCELLKARGISIIAIGRPVHEEELKSTFDGAQIIVGESADRIADLMLRSNGFMGIDSGMTHYAGLLGVKAVAVSMMFPASLLWELTEVRGYRADATQDEIVEALL